MKTDNLFAYYAALACALALAASLPLLSLNLHPAASAAPVMATVASNSTR